MARCGSRELANPRDRERRHGKDAVVVHEPQGEDVGVSRCDAKNASVPGARRVVNDSSVVRDKNVTTVMLGRKFQ